MEQEPNPSTGPLQALVLGVCVLMASPPAHPSPQALVRIKGTVATKDFEMEYRAG